MTSNHLKLAKDLYSGSLEQKLAVLVSNFSALQDADLQEVIKEEINDTLGDLKLNTELIIYDWLEKTDLLKNRLVESFENLDVQNNVVQSPYKRNDLNLIALERAFTVTNQGRVCIGVLQGSKSLKPKQKFELFSPSEKNDGIIPVELTSAGMFYKQMNQNEPGDRVNCLVKSKTLSNKQLEKYSKKGAVLVPGGTSRSYYRKEFQFEDSGFDETLRYQKVSCYTWTSVPVSWRKSDGIVTVEMQHFCFLRPGDRVVMFTSSEYIVAKVMG